MTNFLGISTGSSSISAGSGPKSADFSKFSRLHALCGKKLVKMGSKNGKIATKRKRKLIFKNFQRLHAPCGKKLRNFATGNGNGVQKCLKTMFFEKKHAPFGKKLQN